MAIHRVYVDDFICSDYELLALHSSLEDYRLAFFLNQLLNLKLVKGQNSIELKTKNGKGVFDYFFFNDDYNDLSWYLINNKTHVLTEIDENIGFFDAIPETTHLVPEFKTADFIIKIENTDATFNTTEIIKKISVLHPISTLYTINSTQLKSKNNLIF